MGRNAVLLTVLFALTVTLFSVSYIFLEFYKLNREQYINNTFLKYTVISRIYREHMQKRTSTTMLEANLALYSLYTIDDAEAAKNIAEEGKVLKSENFQAMREENPFQMRIFYCRDLAAVFFFLTKRSNPTGPGTYFMLTWSSSRVLRSPTS
jgi:two-component system OmpR family sensor kinase